MFRFFPFNIRHLTLLDISLNINNSYVVIFSYPFGQSKPIMHELSLCQDILETIQRRTTNMDYSRIKSVTLEIGELSCVEKFSLLFSFDVIAKGTIAEHAILNINEIKAKAWCLICKIAVPVSQFYEPCINCGNLTGELVQGNELIVKSMEIV